ncbi:hypothetical protein KUCAC02_030192 [Chaenocephalus aceratus]|uniref:Uncharacterized protein n=1 Tax=Chaenocephalus aceratus TaxID=36190 RepID=A0ACB9XJ08_CHAAC|nr:hypothetical protein KUCAC02_030192 [Chaenocephalus aceratus]
MVSTKTYFKLLQAIHRGEILDEAARRESPPPSMARKAQFLTSFIKQAAPNCHTLKLVEENTRMWLQRNLEILKTYYSYLLTVLSVDLPPFRSDAFDRAIIWARKRYHNKLTPSSISALHSLLNSSDPPHLPPLWTSPTPSRFHPYHCPRDPADCLLSPLAFPTLSPFLPPIPVIPSSTSLSSPSSLWQRCPPTHLRTDSAPPSFPFSSQSCLPFYFTPSGITSIEILIQRKPCCTTGLTIWVCTRTTKCRAAFHSFAVQHNQPLILSSVTYGAGGPGTWPHVYPDTLTTRAPNLEKRPPCLPPPSQAPRPLPN